MLFSVLLLLLSLSYATAVCEYCRGNAEGCPGSKDSCPWFLVTGANLSTIAAGAGAALVIDGLLPLRIRRIFTRPILDSLGAMCVAVGTAFTFAGKTHPQILEALKQGRITKDEASMNELTAISSLPSSTSAEEFSRRSQQSKIFLEAVRIAQPAVHDASMPLEGAMIFVLFKLSHFFSEAAAGSSTAELLTGDFATTSESDAKATASGKSYTARLKRPQSLASMMSLLNMFVAVCHATSIAGVLAMTAFLDDVVYEPVRLGVIPWPVGFECLLIYLRMLESQAQHQIYTLANIVSRAGGMDAIRAEAATVAHSLYPAAFFRGVAGNANPSGGKPPSESVLGEAHFKGRVKGNNPKSKTLCVAYNNGTPHLAKHVDANGFCVYRHACNQFVANKGADGRCEGAHPRCQGCDYEEAQKLTPAQAKALRK